MSVFTATIKRYSLASISRSFPKVVARDHKLELEFNAKQSPSASARAMHIQSIPMCKSTLMEHFDQANTL
jgi:hypothetical protein